jgi:aromatic ring-opening dioxygenase LigB subunit
MFLKVRGTFRYQRMCHLIHHLLRNQKDKVQTRNITWTTLCLFYFTNHTKIKEMFCTCCYLWFFQKTRLVAMRTNATPKINSVRLLIWINEETVACMNNIRNKIVICYTHESAISFQCVCYEALINYGIFSLGQAQKCQWFMKQSVFNVLHHQE